MLTMVMILVIKKVVMMMIALMMMVIILVKETVMMMMVKMRMMALQAVFSPGFCLGESQGPPLLRNRGPVRTLGGQSYKKHAVRRTLARTPNCLLHEVPT